MGAYYHPTNIKDKEYFYSWDYHSGQKMMEHSYIGNTFVNAVIHEIHVGTWKNKPISWICDYTDDDDMLDAYNNSLQLPKPKEEMWLGDYNNVIIANNDKREYIDLGRIIALWEEDRGSVTHPFPLLTSSEKSYMGGGDYHPDHKHRGRWSGDRFVVYFNKLEVPKSYKDVSRSSLFYETKTNHFTKKALKQTDMPDLETRQRELTYLDKEASKEEVIHFLKTNEKSLIKFYKADGSYAEKTAFLNPKHESSSEYKPENEKYLHFIDAKDGNRLKKFIWANFQGAEKVA